MDSFEDLLHTKLYGNTVAEWGLAAIAFLVTFTVLPLLKSYLMRVAKRRPQASDLIVVQVLLRLIPRTSRLFVLVVALNAALRFVDFQAKIERGLGFLIQVGLWFQIGLWAVTVVQYFLDRKQQSADQRDSGFAGSFGIVNFVAQVVIWAVVVLLALDNMGVNITALVAGLGVGGIAIALAVQTMLGDLLASLSITFDKPFAVGDSLAVDSISGKVEQIGIRSTRLRSADGEQVILSNTDLVKSRVRNFGRMEERRGFINIGITYETPRDKVRKAGALIEQAIRSEPDVRLERCHFKEFGDSALKFEAVFFMLKPDFAAFMSAQQSINYRILDAFADEGIEFAYPTQTVRIANPG